VKKWDVPSEKGNFNNAKKSKASEIKQKIGVDVKN